MAFRKRSARFGGVLIVCAALLGTPAAADEYDQEQAGHPLRIIAYVLHPVGWFLDYFIFEPFHKIGNSPPGRVIFGHEDDYREREDLPPLRTEAPAAPEADAAAPSDDDSEI